jgi:hypothetical protein
LIKKGLHGFTVYSFEIDIKMIRNSNYSLIGVGYRIKKTINTKRFCFVSVCFFLFFFVFSFFFVCFLFTMNLDVVMIYFPLFVKIVLIYFLIILFCFIKRFQALHFIKKKIILRHNRHSCISPLHGLIAFNKKYKVSITKIWKITLISI